MSDDGAKTPVLRHTKSGDILGHPIKAASSKGAGLCEPLTGQIKRHDVMGFGKAWQDIAPCVRGGARAVQQKQCGAIAHFLDVPLMRAHPEPTRGGVVWPSGKVAGP